MTRDEVSAVLERVRAWPKEDQEHLAELARAIEAQRKGIYTMTDDECRAVDEALAGPLASDDEVRAFWREHGIVK